jgi:hypothetical protein
VAFESDGLKLKGAMPAAPLIRDRAAARPSRAVMPDLGP